MRKKGSKKRLSKKIKIENRRSNRERVSKLKILKLLILLFFIGTLVWGTRSLLRAILDSEELRVKSVVVLGDYPDRDQIKEGFESYCLKEFGCKRPNILKLGLADLRKYLEAFPRVRKVRIRRRLPGTIFIEVDRRIPMALIPNGTSILGCDKERIFEIVSSSKYDLPFITGLTKIEEDGIKEARRIILRMRDTIPSLVPMISEINVTDAQNLSAYTMKNIQIYFGDIDRYDLDQRLVKLKGVLDYIERVHLPVEYIDLRFDRVVIKPKG